MPFSSVFCGDPLPYNSQIRRFDPKYWSIDFPLTAIATIVNTDDDAFTVYSNHRSNRDLIGVIWSTEDRYGHPALNYQSNYDYTGVKLAFQSNLLNRFNATITINDHVIRLYPYSKTLNTLAPVSHETIPENRPKSYSFDELVPGGKHDPDLPWFVIDFDDLILGFNREGERVSPIGIYTLFISITSLQYGLGDSATLMDEGRAWGSPSNIKTTRVEYFRIKCDSGVILSKGDRIKLALSTPRVEGDGKGATTAYDYQTVDIEVNEFDDLRDDDGNFIGYRIKAYEPMDNVCWIGRQVTPIKLRKDSPTGDIRIDTVFKNISVTASDDAKTKLLARDYPQPENTLQMTSGYDDTYNITPWRQVYQAYKLGYRGLWTTYMGMSHYYKALGGVDVDGHFKMHLDKDAVEPLNIPTVKHCESLFHEMKRYGFTFVWSTAYEILNSVIPPEWRQLNADQEPALTGWVPPSSFIQPSNDECLNYLGRVIIQGLNLLKMAGHTELRFQVGEPWWWDGSYSNRMPCLYDPHTREKYERETGNKVPEPWVRDFMDPVTPTQRPYFEWLGDQLGQSTGKIRDQVKSAFPEADCTLLFFTPQIMNPSSEMLTIINFPIEYWKYPAYDFMQIEDYDWLINGELEYNDKTFEAALDILKYPVDVVEYFVGFVLYPTQAWIWPNMDWAIWNSLDHGVKRISVWAYPQVIRDGMLFSPGPRPPEPGNGIAQGSRHLAGAESDNITPHILVNVNDEMYLHSGVGDRDYLGQVWSGVGSLGKISNVDETLTGSLNGLSLSLGPIPYSLISEATKPRRNQSVTIYIVLGDNLEPKKVLDGVIAEHKVLPEERSIFVEYRIRNKMIDSLRRDSSRYNHASQVEKYPGDMGLEFMGSLKNQRLEWGANASKSDS